MVITSQITTDIVGQTQILVISNSGPLDQILYSNNQITFGTSSTYNLSKADLALWGQFLNTFNNLLIINFPSIASSIGLAWPLCVFDFTENDIGVKRLIYNQTSNGTTVININYLPIATSAAFATRSSPVTITLQEYFMFILMMAQYFQQVNLN